MSVVVLSFFFFSLRLSGETQPTRRSFPPRGPRRSQGRVSQGETPRPYRINGRSAQTYIPASRRQDFVLCPNQSWSAVLSTGDGGGYQGVHWEIRGRGDQRSRRRFLDRGRWPTQDSGSSAAALRCTEGQDEIERQREAAGEVRVSIRVARTLLWRSHHGVSLQSADQGEADTERDPAEGDQRHQCEP